MIKGMLINGHNNIIMGACCQHFFEKEEVHSNDSRLKLLQSKVNVSYHTENDNNFTYYLHLFEQHLFLQKVLKTYKMATEQTEDTSEIVSNEQVALEHKQIENYMRAFKDETSALRLKMRQDEDKILAEIQREKGGANLEEACLIKLEIQCVEVVKGISRIRLVQQSGGKEKEEFLIMGRMNKQKIFREFIFASSSKSRIKIISDPIFASITIDVQDIAKEQVLCEIFNLKAKNQDLGFIALRIQYVTTNQAYLKEKHQRVVMLQKELKLCQMGKDGLQRLSQYHSESNSMRNTFLSEPVSEYPNQYQA